MALPFAICISCSRFTKKDGGKPVYKICDNFSALREHCRKSHSSIMSEDCLINVDMTDFHVLQERVNQTYCLMAKSDIPKEAWDYLAFLPHLGGGKEHIMKEDYLSLVGWNSRTLATSENAFMMKKYLDEEVPDVVFLNEIGDCGKKFSQIKTHEMITNSTKVGLFFNTRMKVHRIFDELNDDHNLICKMCTEGKRAVFLYSVYLAPGEGHKERTEKMIYNLVYLKNRYENPAIFLFGDLNMKRDEALADLVELTDRGFKVIYKEGGRQFTRAQLVDGEIKTSYLDYFISLNVPQTDIFTVDSPIGNSDHCSLKTRIPLEKGVPDFVPTMEIKINFNQPKKDAQTIYDDFKNVISQNVPLTCGGIERMVRNLKRRYRPKLRKKKNFFRISDKIKKYLAEKEQGKKDFYWENFRKIVSSSNSEEYRIFMEEFEKLDKSRSHREYFRRLKFYSDVDKRVEVLKDLKVANDIITDHHEIGKLVTVKYKVICQDAGKKSVYRSINQRCIIIQPMDIDSAIHHISLDKAVSWDFIPGIIFKEFKKLKKTNIDEYCFLCNKLSELLNFMLKTNYIPEDIATARLVCLNKN